MRVLLSAISVLIAAVLLWPDRASACSYAVVPGELVLPLDEAQGIPLNARVHVATSNPFGGPDEFALVLLDGGSDLQVAISVEPLPFASQLEGRVRLTPTSSLVPNAPYAVCHWPQGTWRGDGGCPESDRIGTFTTGTDAVLSPPPAATGLVFEVADVDFPDAGPNLFCSGPRRVRGVSVHVPDAARQLLFFGRAGDAGIFSAEPGAWLPNGIRTVGGTAAGILACDGEASAPLSSWGLPTGTTALEVWTEDVAGNASAPVLIPLQGDCTTQPDSGTGEVDDAPPSSGCSGAGGGGIAFGLASLAVLFWRRQSARAR
ncbi:MAG: hypothetical protein WBV82_30380 [Myxococcaceae bacterium]